VKSGRCTRCTSLGRGLVQSAHLGAPQRVGVGQHHALGPRGGARGVLDPRRSWAETSPGRPRQDLQGAKKRRRRSRRRRSSPLRGWRRSTPPSGPSALPLGPSGSGSLGDNAHRPRVLPEVGHLSTEDRVLVLTAMAPMRVQANQATTNSGQFSRCRMTRSPGATPRARRPEATRRTSPANSA